MNKSEAIMSALAQVDAIHLDNSIRPPVRVKMSGHQDEAPPWLAEGVSEIIGRPVAIEWSKQVEKVVSSNTGAITDGIERYYADAKRRGARTGD